MITSSAVFSRPVQVLSVASELFPHVKTGGLGDVVASLPVALADYGVCVRTLVPGYPAILAAMAEEGEIIRLPDVLGHEGSLRVGRVGGIDLMVLDLSLIHISEPTRH